MIWWYGNDGDDKDDGYENVDKDDDGDNDSDKGSIFRSMFSQKPVRHDSRPWSKRQTPPGQLCPTALDGPWGSILVIFNDIRTTQKY